MKIDFMKLLQCIAALFLTAMVISCSSTKIISSWKADDAKAKAYHNVMVWGILPEKDSAIRRQVENHLVEDLVSKGYHAISSLAVYEEKAYKKLSATDIVGEFKQTGVDAVITMVLLKKEKDEKYYPAVSLSSPENITGNLDRYYTEVYQKVLTPGYYIKTTNYFWEANLFEVAADKHTYSVRTRSFDPASSEKLAHENGELIIKDMLKKKIILDKMPKEED